MTANEFRAAILLLRYIRANEFLHAIFGPAKTWDESQSVEAWGRFYKDPVEFYIHATDVQRKALWNIMQKRLTVGDGNDGQI